MADRDYSIETEHFRITYRELEKACIDEIVMLLERRYAVITQRLGKEREQKTNIEICTDHDDLHRALGIVDGPEWIRGGLVSGKVVIASPLAPPPGSDYDNVINTAVHEFVHVLLREINPKLPRWLDEGIASFEGKDNSMDWIEQTVRDGLKNGSVPTIKDLDTGGDYEKFFERNGYQYSYTIIECITQKYGYGLLRELLADPSGSTSVFKTAGNGLPPDSHSFEREWNDFLKEKYA